MASRKAVAFLLANPDIAKAYAEGKPIQFRSKSLKYGEVWSEWDTTGELTFNEQYDYRLKPEPKMFYIIRNGRGTSSLYDISKTAAEKELVKYNETGPYKPYTLEEYKQVL